MIKDLDQKIKKYSELKGYSQDFIACELNLSTKAYSNVENGLTRITIERLNRISEILEIDPLTLINFEFHKVVDVCTAKVLNNEEYESKNMEDRLVYLECKLEVLFRLLSKPS